MHSWRSNHGVERNRMTTNRHEKSKIEQSENVYNVRSLCDKYKPMCSYYGEWGTGFWFGIYGIPVSARIIIEFFQQCVKIRQKKTQHWVRELSANKWISVLDSREPSTFIRYFFPHEAQTVQVHKWTRQNIVIGLIKTSISVNYNSKK